MNEIKRISEHVSYTSKNFGDIDRVGIRIERQDNSLAQVTMTNGSLSVFLALVSREQLADMREAICMCLNEWNQS